MGYDTRTRAKTLPDLTPHKLYFTLNPETPLGQRFIGDGVGALGAGDDDPVSGMRINENGEGHIYVHAGIHGVGGENGLSPATHD